MSVTVRHLNADSTFLLVFSPQLHPSRADLQSAQGAFSVLIDPWLVGSSIVNASWFAVTRRVIPSAIQHLSQIEEPDIVLVTQNKPDHCHKQTLLQLQPEGKTLIVAEAGAAKAIKSWNYFDPHRVHALTKYDIHKRFGNVLRLRIPPLAADGSPGELSIAFIPAKNYITGLHNGFGITYQPAAHVKALASVTTIDLPQRRFSMPFSPASLPTLSPIMMFTPDPQRPNTSHIKQTVASPAQPIDTINGHQEYIGYRSQLSRCSNTQSSEFLPVDDQPKVLYPAPTSAREVLLRAVRTDRVPPTMPTLKTDAATNIDTTDFADTTYTPAQSPIATSTTRSPRISDTSDLFENPITAASSTNTSISCSLPFSPSLKDVQAQYSRPPTIHPPRPKVLSVLYSPHGLPLQDLQPYIQNHLVSLPGALPLTCLIHGFNYATNPWWFGGNIMMGAKGGTEIAKALMARTWISAHDEIKDDRGIAVKLLKCERTSPEIVQRKIGADHDRWDCDVRALGVGEEICLTSSDEATMKSSRQSSDTLGLGVDMAAFNFRDGRG